MKYLVCALLLVIAQGHIGLSITKDEVKESLKLYLEIQEIMNSLPAENIVLGMKKTLEMIKRLPVALEGYAFLATTSDDNYKKVTGEDVIVRKQQLVKMRAVMDSINERSTELDGKLTTTLIDWTKIDKQIPLVQTSLFSMMSSLIRAYKAPWQVSHIFISEFKAVYDRHDRVSKHILELYLQKGDPIHKNVFVKAREYFKNDPKTMARFADFYTRLFMQSLIIDFTYRIFSGKAVENRRLVEKYMADAHRYLERAAVIDREVRDSWTFLYSTEVDQLAKVEIIDKSMTSNEKIASAIYEFLRKKYTQRKWFVLVHDYTGDNDKDRYYDNCGQYVKKIGNKKVVVNSLDANVKGPKFPLPKIFWQIQPELGHFGPFHKLAKILFEKYITKMGCDKRQFVGAIEEKSHPEYHAAGGHTYKEKVGMTRLFHAGVKFYMLIVFG